MPQNQLVKELQFYNKNKAEYLKSYKNKYLLIKDNTLCGSFDTNEEAYKKGVDTFGNEPFLIKQVLEQEPTLTVSSLYVGMRNASL